MTIYLVIGILIVGLLVVMWKYPQTILSVLILATPLQRYSIYISQIELSLKLLMILLPAAYFIVFFRSRVRWVFDKKVFLFSALLLVGIFSSVFTSVNPLRTLSVVAFSLSTFAYVYLVIILIRDTKDFKRMVHTFLIVGTAVSMAGIWQFVMFSLGYSPDMPLVSAFPAKTISADSFVYNIGENILLRPSSTFIDTNIAAGFLTIVVLLSLVYLFDVVAKKSWQSILVAMVVFLVNVVAFSMTISRSAYLGLVVAGIVFVIWNWRIFWRKWMIVFATTVLILIGVSVVLFDTPFEAMFERTRTTFFEHDSTGSTEEHMRFTNVALDIFYDNPIVGIGAGNFEEYYLSKIDSSEDTAYTYNVYAGFLAETGILGFLSQLVFMGFVIWEGMSGVKFLEGDIRGRLALSALVCGYIAILIANLFYAYYILFFVWLLIGLILGGARVILENNNEK